MPYRNGGGIRRSNQCGGAEYGYYVCSTHFQHATKVLTEPEARLVNVWALQEHSKTFTTRVASRISAVAQWRPGICEGCALWLYHNGPVTHWMDYRVSPDTRECNWLPACQCEFGILMPQHECIDCSEPEEHDFPGCEIVIPDFFH